MRFRERKWLDNLVLAVTIFVALPAFGQYRGSCEFLLIPDVYTLSIVPNVRPQIVETRAALSSPAVTDSWLSLGRRTVAYPDFKYISDLEPKLLSEEERRAVILEAKQRRRQTFNEALASGLPENEAVRHAQASYARRVIEGLYREETGLGPYQGDIVKARLHLSPGSGPKDLDFAQLSEAFAHVERTWSALARQSPVSSAGSLLPSPYPFLVAGGRFKESYYWDAYFGALGLIETGRWEMAAAQFENLLHMIQAYGLIPNGFRDYYLTRSQPPVIALFALLIFDHAPPTIAKEKLHHWMSKRVYPLLRRDYHEFWMTKRYHSESGLNFHSDELNQMRPERHSNDDERALGETFRDVRGEAESGLDHTEASMGASSHVASVMLNSLMYSYERALARMAGIAGNNSEARAYHQAADKRRRAMNRHNWDEHAGVFRNYHLRDKHHSPVVSADMFSAMYVGLTSPEQARRMVDFAQQVLQRPGGLKASTSNSGKQWDGAHGWAPFHVMAIGGAARYGHVYAARDWARRWASALAKIHGRTGHFYEKIDVERVSAPHEDDSKYPTQTGFLWTNASYVWALKHLGFRFKD